MIIVDANILLYAYNSTSAHHLPAKKWVEDSFYGKEIIGIPWVSSLAFLRISTNPLAFNYPLSMLQASKIVSSWYESNSVISIESTDRHWEILSELLTHFQITSKLTTDAHLAALCLEHNASICTNDLDFTRFTGLKIINPVN